MAPALRFVSEPPSSGSVAAPDSSRGAATEPWRWHRYHADSLEHRMLESLSFSLGVSLHPRVMVTDDGARIEVEGLDEACTVIAQVVPNLGAVASPQRNKALAELLKLVWLSRAVVPSARPVLGVTEPVARFFSASAWPARAASDLGVEVFVCHPGAAAEPLFSPNMPDGND